MDFAEKCTSWKMTVLAKTEFSIFRSVIIEHSWESHRFALGRSTCRASTRFISSSRGSIFGKYSWRSDSKSQLTLSDSVSPLQPSSNTLEENLKSFTMSVTFFANFRNVYCQRHCLFAQFAAYATHMERILIINFPKLYHPGQVSVFVENTIVSVGDGTI